MHRKRGFTLIELLVVLAIVAMLLSIVTPRYIHQADRAKEAALRENLTTLRISIDKYNADKGHYPTQLADLVQERYLRQLPMDPVTNQNNSWQPVLIDDGNNKVIYDVKSGATGKGLDGSAYNSW